MVEGDSQLPQIVLLRVCSGMPLGCFLLCMLVIKAEMNILVHVFLLSGTDISVGHMNGCRMLGLAFIAVKSNRCGICPPACELWSL